MAAGTAAARVPARDRLARLPAERLSLVDLLDRVLAGGVVISGEITLSVADVDLVTISLRALLASAGALLPPQARADGALPGPDDHGEDGS